MKQSKRKKKRSAPSKSNHEIGAANSASRDDEQRIIQCLAEAFSLASNEEVKVYEQTGRDADKAAEVLSGLSEKLEDQTASSSSSSSRFTGSSLTSSDDFDESNHGKEGVNSRGFRGNKGKKVVAATGTVSTVLGKDYVTAASRKEITIPRRSGNGKINVEETEQFVYSMLGDDHELSMAVVKDVLGQCGYDVDKTMDILLELSGSSFDSSGSDRCSLHSGSSGEDSKYSDFSYESFWEMSDISDSTSHSSEDNGWPVSYPDRSYSEALLGSKSSKGRSNTDTRNNKFELPHEVLESLFNIPRRPSVHEPDTMNWRNVVKKLESFAQKRNNLCSPITSTLQQNTNDNGDGYLEFRGTAANHWNTMKSNYQKAATAYSNGSKEHASYLSDKAKQYGKSALEADERASIEIFKARNKNIGNVLTIDLHGQHVKPAMKLVKLHLLFGTFVSSIQFLKIITGCGSHGLGKSKLKQSITALMKKEGIQWKEENQGMILVKLEGPREFSFLDIESDSE